jgi:nicotinate dehydrogenase subunit B
VPRLDVRGIYVEGAGCYGRNGHEDAAGDAALLARAVGKPVRVQWMRAGEHGWDPKGPPTLLDMRAGLDRDGSVTAWESELFVPDGTASFVALVGADLAGRLGKLSPGGVLNDLAIPYQFPNVTTSAHRLESTPLRPAWIRSPERLQNTFANESFIDEIAAEVGANPLDIRLKYLDDARGKEVLERVARLSKWRERPKRDRNAEIVTGRGLAYVNNKLVRTYVGVVAEVEVNRKTGDLAVKRFYVAHDCGQIINPDGLRNQIEGSIVQTVRHAQGGSDLRPLDGDEPRLVELSDPDLFRGAGRGDRSHRPTRKRFPGAAGSPPAPSCLRRSQEPSSKRPACAYARRHLPR